MFILSSTQTSFFLPENEFPPNNVFLAGLEHCAFLLPHLGRSFPTQRALFPWLKNVHSQFSSLLSLPNRAFLCGTPLHRTFMTWKLLRPGWESALSSLVKRLYLSTLALYSPPLTTIFLPLRNRGNRMGTMSMTIITDATMAHKNVVRSDAAYASMTINSSEYHQGVVTSRLLTDLALA